MILQCFVFVVAIFGSIVVGSLAWSQPNSEDHHSQEEGIHSIGIQDQQLKQAHTDIVTALKGLETAVRDLKPESSDSVREAQQQREVRDLDAQEAMASWAERMFYATLASVILTFGALLAIVRTLHHTKRAADYTAGMLVEAKATTEAAKGATNAAKEANDIVGRAQRPYVFVSDDGPNPIEWLNGGTTFCWKFSVGNYGSVPAIIKTCTVSVEFSPSIPRVVVGSTPADQPYWGTASGMGQNIEIPTGTVLPSQRVLNSTRMSSSILARDEGLPRAPEVDQYMDGNMHWWLVVHIFYEGPSGDQFETKATYRSEHWRYRVQEYGGVKHNFRR